MPLLDEGGQRPHLNRVLHVFVVDGKFVTVSSDYSVRVWTLAVAVAS